MDNNKWIPVSERLPEIGKDVLVTYGNLMYVCFLETVDDRKIWEDDYGYWHSIDSFTAWMPLPEPYKGE